MDGLPFRLREQSAERDRHEQEHADRERKGRQDFPARAGADPLPFGDRRKQADQVEHDVCAAEHDPDVLEYAEIIHAAREEAEDQTDAVRELSEYAKDINRRKAHEHIEAGEAAANHLPDQPAAVPMKDLQIPSRPAQALIP